MLDTYFKSVYLRVHFKKPFQANMEKFLKISLFLMLGATLALTSCRKKEKSSSTGWNYNDPKWGGFEKKKYEGQATGPNLV